MTEFSDDELGCRIDKATDPEARRVLLRVQRLESRRHAFREVIEICKRIERGHQQDVDRAKELEVEHGTCTTVAVVQGVAETVRILAEFPEFMGDNCQVEEHERDEVLAYLYHQDGVLAPTELGAPRDPQACAEFMRWLSTSALSYALDCIVHHQRALVLERQLRRADLKIALERIAALEAGTESTDRNIGEECGLARAQQAIQDLIDEGPVTP